MKRQQITFMVYRFSFLLFCVLLTRILTIPLLSQLQGIRRFYHGAFGFNVETEEKKEFAVMAGVRSDKFLEVPQIVWGLNNQKIALGRAALTARKLNRTLLMPKLSASLFFKETDLLQPIDFDRIFSLDGFNSRCHGFVQIARNSQAADALVVRKGNGRRWTTPEDLAQLDECANNPDIDRHAVIKLEGKNPFLWHDHWSVKDYATVFECLVLVDELSAEASRVVTKLREVESSPKYVAVHMRIEKDWMIHCKKLETRARIRDGKYLQICSSKEEIKRRVAKISELEKPSTVYLAVADALLEDRTLLEGWSHGLVPYEKKKLGVASTYARYPYLIQSAIDYEVCLQADVFVGNSFSTFSSLIALQRTVRRKRGDASNNGCEGTYAYNIEGPGGGPQRWATNMSDLSFEAISYGSNQVSCM